MSGNNITKTSVSHVHGKGSNQDGELHSIKDIGSRTTIKFPKKPGEKEGVEIPAIRLNKGQEFNRTGLFTEYREHKGQKLLFTKSGAEQFDRANAVIISDPFKFQPPPPPAFEITIHHHTPPNGTSGAETGPTVGDLKKQAAAAGEDLGNQFKDKDAKDPNTKWDTGHKDDPRWRNV